MPWQLIGTVFGVLGIIVFGIAAVVFMFYRKVKQGEALIVSKLGKVVVSFTGQVVVPIIHKAEVIDISVKAMEVERTSKNGLICHDNIRADIRVTFYVRVNKTEEDVLKVAQAVGCDRASTKETLEELFNAKFSEALKTVGKQMDFTTLFTEREHFKEQILQVIGQDLNGYALEDVAIDFLEQTPMDSLDPDNVLDAQGIRKITDLTSTEAIATNEFQRNRQRVIRQQDVETREKILELERQQADAEAKQEREIAVVRSREHAEAEKVAAEEHLKAERARIIAEEEVAVAEENKQRQIEVAAKARERTIAVETERVQRDRDLEAVERERLVAVKSIEKEKAVEIERKKIQDVIRERVMVEKTVAEEEERIKDTREFAAAERTRKTEVIAAEREAEELLIREVKAAEAKERAAKSLYEEAITMAEAERLTAEKEAEAEKTRALGVVHRDSAGGLAQVKVKEAEAGAVERMGKAEGAADTERHKAKAFGIQSDGEAAAKAMAAKYDAEAVGIDKKAAAMKKLDGIGREHEEFKLELSKRERVELAGIEVNRHIAEAQARVMGEAVKTAKIDLVGGDGRFLETFFRSISLAKSVDGFVEHSDIAQDVVGDQSELLGKLKELVGKEGLKAEDLKNLSAAALLARLASRNRGEGHAATTTLPDTLKNLSAEDLMSMWLAK